MNLDSTSMVIITTNIPNMNKILQYYIIKDHNLSLK